MAPVREVRVAPLQWQINIHQFSANYQATTVWTPLMHRWRKNWGSELSPRTKRAVVFQCFHVFPCDSHLTLCNGEKSWTVYTDTHMQTHTLLFVTQTKWQSRPAWHFSPPLSFTLQLRVLRRTWQFNAGKEDKQTICVRCEKWGLIEQMPHVPALMYLLSL